VLQARDGTGVPSVVLSPHWTKEGSLIYRKGQSEVLALSPSDGAMLASFHEIARGMEPLLPAVSATKKRAISIEPNKAAIVLSVRVEARTFLLGADLEVSSVPQIGWHAVRTCNLRHPEPAGFFKVPHHGSENADDQLVWDEMLQEGPIAALTPFTRSSLPKAADLARLATRTNRIYCTARSTGYSPRPRPVDKWGVLMRNRRALSGPMGHVRYRVSDTDPVGTVALFGAAYQFAP
jgi:hypothetical protein